MDVIATTKFHGTDVGPLPADPISLQEKLASREALLAEITAISRFTSNDRESYLVVINFADTGRYNEVVGVFGFRFAELVKSLKLERFDHLRGRASFYDVATWSIGLIFTPKKRENPELFFDELANALGEEIICRGVPITLDGGVGVCNLKTSVGACEELLQAAFLAARCDRRPPYSWMYVTNDILEEQRRRFSLISDFRCALNDFSDFEMTFLPRLDLRTSRYVAAVAVLNWRHPCLDSSAPSEIISLAETTGSVSLLAESMLTRCLTEVARWNGRGCRLPVSIRIPGRFFYGSGFLDGVLSSLLTLRLQPNQLELEVSESELVEDLHQAHAQLQALQSHGIKIAVDDFGSGPDSFRYLSKLPFDRLKLRSSLVQSMAKSSEAEAVVRSLISLAHNLKADVIADGVESELVLAKLVRCECDFAQGYQCNRALKGRDFDAWCYEHLSRPDAGQKPP